jgi:integrase
MNPRKRHQAGSVQQRRRGGKLAWVGLYRDALGKRCITALDGAKTRSQALSRMAEFLVPINKEREQRKDANMTLAEYAEKVYIPHKENGRWKASTAITSAQQIQQYIVKGSIGETPLSELNREAMQTFLNGLGNVSASVVNHLRFHLKAICRLAVADGLMARNQAEALYTPRTCALPDKPVMSAVQVSQALAALDIRERAFCRLAIYAGIRPGEIIALRWSDLHGESITVDDRVYKGQSAEPKNRKPREVSLSPAVVRDLMLWKQFALDSDYIFASESRTTPIKYENLWQREIRPRFKALGLEWADFRCMRRTNSTLMKAAGADVKVSADQRGHNVITSINEYTQSTPEEKHAAVNLLEKYISAHTVQ